MERSEGSWPVVKEMAADALEKPPEERAEFLERVCTDPRLRSEVDRLIQACEGAAESGHFLHSPAFETLSPATFSDEGTSIPAAALRDALAGSYSIERELGRGGMATVYLARDERHGRPVALKVVHPHIAALDSVATDGSRFRREIRIAARLTHPHILSLHDSGAAAGLLYYTMPFVDGESLRDRIVREPLPLPDALRVLHDVARALAHAHRQGIVHRDIKPENILLNRDGDALVADFGVARALEAAAEADESEGTATGSLSLLFGTPTYMAPEQASRSPEPDHRADLYSFGVVAYELLAGSPPFRQKDRDELVKAHQVDQPESLASLRPDLPTDLISLVMSLLAKRPEDRPPDADAVVRTLDQVVAIPGERVPAATLSAFVARRFKSRRGGWVAIAAGGLAVFVAGYLISRALGIGPSADTPVRRYRLAVPAGKDLRNSLLAPALSPDGSRWVFVGPMEDGRSGLYLQDRNQVAPMAIASTAGGINPFFSPDGRKVAYITSYLPGDRTPRELKVVPLSGGPPVTLARDLASLASGAGSWSRDGYLYVPNAGGSIMRVPEAGGIPDTVSTIDLESGETGHAFPEVLPNGKGVLFSVFRGQNPEDRDIAVLDLATGKHTILIRGIRARYASTGHVIFVNSEGTLLAAPFDADRLRLTGFPVALGERVAVRGIIAWTDFALSANGTLLYLGGPPGPILAELVWVGRDGTPTAIDSNWVTDFESLALSPDGTRLAAAIGAAGSWPVTERHIWGKRFDQSPPVKLTFAGNPNHRPAWSPDGRRIAFLSERGGRRELYTRPTDDGAPDTRLLGLDRPLDEVAWSRDGRWLVLGLGASDDPGRDIVAIRPGIDSAPISIVATPADEKAPTLSPDGRFMAYVSDESGRNEVYVRPFPDAVRAKWQVSIDGGTEPLWSHSGRELFYRSAGYQQYLVAAEIRTRPGFTIEQRRQLFRLSFFRASPTHRAYDVTPDDQRFIMIRVRTKDNLELLLVENWFTELTEKVARP